MQSKNIFVQQMLIILLQASNICQVAASEYLEKITELSYVSLGKRAPQEVMWSVGEIYPVKLDLQKLISERRKIAADSLEAWFKSNTNANPRIRASLDAIAPYLPWEEENAPKLFKKLFIPKKDNFSTPSPALLETERALLTYQGFHFDDDPSSAGIEFVSGWMTPEINGIHLRTLLDALLTFPNLQKSVQGVPPRPYFFFSIYSMWPVILFCQDAAEDTEWQKGDLLLNAAFPFIYAATIFSAATKLFREYLLSDTEQRKRFIKARKKIATAIKTAYSGDPRENFSSFLLTVRDALHEARVMSPHASTFPTVDLSLDFPSIEFWRINVRSGRRHLRNRSDGVEVILNYLPTFEVVRAIGIIFSSLGAAFVPVMCGEIWGNKTAIPEQNHHDGGTSEEEEE